MIAGLFFLAALMYSAVGHAGASGYLAVMALIGIAPAEMRPAALILNLVVASLGAVTFFRAGHFKWNLAWPFLVGSVPMAWLGGRLVLPVELYRTVIGVVLLLSAIRFFVTIGTTDSPGKPPRRSVAVFAGAVLGLLAGLTGVGGGIFLSPLILFCGWASLRTTAATAVVFIWANSAAGLAGQFTLGLSLPDEMFLWIVAVACGGYLGSWLGASRLSAPAIRATLAVVLMVAGVKLL